MARNKRRNQQNQQKPQMQTNGVSSAGMRPSRAASFFHQYSGYQLETHRDIICQYGYPAAPGFADFYAVGKRIGLGKAVVNLPVNKCWQTYPEVQDVIKFDKDGRPDKTSNSEFVREWNRLVNDRRLQLWERIRGTDRKQRFGMYAGCYIVARDDQARDASKPLDSLAPGQLVKLIPFYEAQLIPTEYEDNLASPNYGDVKMWQLIENSVNPKPGKNMALSIHPSRLIIAAEGSEDGSIYGEPALQGCLYAVMDWEKARASSSEGIKRNNDQRGVITLDDGTNLPAADSPEADLIDESILKWRNGQEGVLIFPNGKYHPVNSTFHDPIKTADMILMEVGASVEIPSTVLVGYQTGRLASVEDSFNFAQSMMQRREGWCTELMFQFIDRFIEVGLLPEPDGEIFIKWDDLTEPSIKDKLELAEKMALTDERRFKTGQAPFFSDSDYSQATGFVGASDGDELGIKLGDEGVEG